MVRPIIVVPRPSWMWPCRLAIGWNSADRRGDRGRADGDHVGFAALKLDLELIVETRGGIQARGVGRDVHVEDGALRVEARR